MKEICKEYHIVPFAISASGKGRTRGFSIDILGIQKRSLFYFNFDLITYPAEINFLIEFEIFFIRILSEEKDTLFNGWFSFFRK